MIANIVIAIIVGYVFGSFPAAYLVGRLRRGIDVRDVGSRNMGAMNVFYQVGPTFAIQGDQFITRHADGTLSSGRDPLDIDTLFSHLKEDDQLDVALPAETRVGHVHLHVRDVAEAVDFYHGILGFDVKGVSSSWQAAFVSAGGYHHHLGLNTWQGAGTPPPPPDALGLRYFTVELPNQAALDDVIRRVDEAGIPSNQTRDGLLLQDPSRNGVILAKAA